MTKRARVTVYYALFISVLLSSYTWSENRLTKLHPSPKTKEIKAESLRDEQVKQRKEHYEKLIKRIQGEVSKVLKKDTSHTLKSNEFLYSNLELADRVPKDEKVIFTQDIGLKKKNLKTKLDVKLGKKRNLKQITNDIHFDKLRVQYNYNARSKQHTIKGYAEVASFNTQVVINSNQKPAFSALRSIKVNKSIKITPSGKYNFGNKTLGLGLSGNLKKCFAATFFVNRSPAVSIIDYSVNGSISNIVDVTIQGRCVCRPESPRASRVIHTSRVIHRGKLLKKLGKHISIQAGLQCVNSDITNPSFTFVYTRKF